MGPGQRKINCREVKNLYFWIFSAALLLVFGTVLTGVSLKGSGDQFLPGPFSVIQFFRHNSFWAVLASAAILSAVFFPAAWLTLRIAPDADRLLLLAVFMLTGLGYMISLRLFPEIAARRPGSAINAYTWQHWYYLLAGLCAMLASAAVFTDNIISRLARRKYVYALCAAILIVLTGIFGTEINGRKLWLPAGPFSFQTVEFVKILAILFAAAYLAERRNFLVSGVETDRLNLSLLNRLGPFAAAAALCILPVIFQKDFGPAFLLVLLMLLMYYFSAGRLLLVASGLALIICSIWIIYHFHLVSMVNTRIDMWLNPFESSEALSRALWAVSSGGLLGKGLGQGMSVNIPAVWSDFTFVVICEELGWLGGLAVTALYLLTVLRGFSIAVHQPDAYRTLLAGGITGVLAIQSLLIMFGNLVLLPLTGITLPLLSYGGSSLIITFIMIGILLKLSSVRGE